MVVVHVVFWFLDLVVWFTYAILLIENCVEEDGDIKENCMVLFGLKF